MNAENTYNQPVAKTKGLLIPWAAFYDTVVWLLSLGKGQAIRQATVKLAQIKRAIRCWMSAVVPGI